MILPKKQSSSNNESNNNAQTTSALMRYLTPLVSLARQMNPSSTTNNNTPTPEHLRALVEENVRRQVHNVCLSDVVVKSWTDAAPGSKPSQNGKQNTTQGGAGEGGDRGPVYVHGWVYELESGRLCDLGISRGPGAGGDA